MNLLAVFLGLFAVAAATNPGFRMRITDQFLQGARKLDRALTEKEFKSLPSRIPIEMLHVPAGAEITDVKIKSHELSNDVIRFAPPNELRYTTSGGRVVLEADLALGDESGTATMTIGGINFDVGLAFGRTDNNKLSITKTQCQLDVTTFDISITGFPGNPAVNRTTHAVVGLVKSVIPTMLCPQLEMALTMTSAKLAVLPSAVLIYEDIYMDSSLTSDPLATTDYIQFDIQGCVHHQGSSPDDCAPQPLVDTADNSRMFYFWSSEAQNNNFLSEFHNRGKFTTTINKDSEAPLDEYYPKVKKHVKNLSDALGQDYNGEDDIEVTMKTASAPKVTIKTNPDKPKKMEELDVSVEITIKVRPGAADEKVIIGVLTAVGDIDYEVKPTAAGQFYPEVEQKLEIKSLTVDSIEGIDVTDAQKTIFSTMVKSSIEKYFNKKIEDAMGKEKMMEQIAKVGKIDDFIYKLNDHTFEMGFNVHVDADELYKVTELADKMDGQK